MKWMSPSLPAPINPDKWPQPDSLSDLASVYHALCRLDAQDQALIQYLRITGQGNVVPVTGQSIFEQDGPSTPHDAFQNQQVSWSDIRRLIDQQREALRSRAAYLSRGQMCHARLMNLSTELLILIVNCLRSSPPLENRVNRGIIPEFPGCARRTVQSLRLTSRLFNTMASPLLFPVIQLSVDCASLAFAECISSNPSLAAGVRVIRISLDNRRAELAANFTSFLRYKSLELVRYCFLLRSERAQIKCRLNRARKSGRLDRVNSLQLALHKHERALRVAKLVSLVMKEYLGVETCNSQHDRHKFEEWETAKYKQLVSKSYEKYSRLYEEQSQLISGKSFVTTVTRLVTQASHPISLDLSEHQSFIEIMDKNESRTPYRSEVALFDFLISTPNWNDTEFPIELSIIADLCIAIREADWIVDDFQIASPPNRFPVYLNLSK